MSTTNFRTSVRGFHRADVVNFIEETTLAHEKALRKLKEEKAQSLIMFHDEIKLTVGAQRTTQEKVQYCLTAVGTSAG